VVSHAHKWLNASVLAVEEIATVIACLIL